MNIRSLALLLLAIPIFSGCNTNSSLQTGRHLATLMLSPQVVDSSYLTQSVVPLYSKASINHLVIKLFKAEVQVAVKDVPNVALDTAVIFANLDANSAYQVRCYAYKAAGTVLSDLISLDDANSYTDVTVSNEDRPVLANVKIKLIDSPFSGQGTNSIALTGGSYADIGSASLDPVIATIVGNGTGAYSGDGGAATSAAISGPSGLAFDSAGNLYIADTSNSRIRKVTAATGIISTVAGTGTSGVFSDGGAATSAALGSLYNLAFDSAGNLYFSDISNKRIRKVTTATGIISTVAGNGTASYSGDNGAATNAAINLPSGLAFDSAGNLYFSDTSNSRIRKVTAATGIITTVAGNGTVGYSGDSGAATSAQLANPQGLAFDSAGNFYIADYSNHRLRKVTTATGIITTVAGIGTQGSSGDGGAATSAALYYPRGVVCDSAGNLYIADQNNHRLRKVTTATGIITTVAGIGTQGSSGDGGTATSAKLYSPRGVACDSAGNLYIADCYNNRIRIVF